MKKNALLGFNLALLAVAIWGFLPIAAKKVLTVMDANTFVFFRFAVAAVGLELILGFAKKLPDLTPCKTRDWLLIGAGVFGLSVYFLGSSYALNFIEPTTSQVLWQLSPFTMMICSLLIFKEKFGRFQQIGLGLLIIGLIAFFNQRASELLQLNAYGVGVVIGAAASMLWVIYGIAQKLLLAKFSSQQILLLIYLGCTLLLAPFANISQVEQLHGWVLLGGFLFCCLNTLIAYGAFAEALNHWDASKVSVITVLIPVFTMGFQAVGHHILPDEIDALDLNWLSYLGAFIVIIGTMLSVVGDKLCRK